MGEGTILCHNQELVLRYGGGGRGRVMVRGGGNKKQMEKGEDENKEWRKIGRRGERGSIVSAQGGL